MDTVLLTSRFEKILILNDAKRSPRARSLKMKTAKLTLLCLIAVLIAGPNAFGQGLKLPFGKKKPGVNQPQGLDLTMKSGPWLIMCASFVGDEGLQQARRLAQELRQKHHLNAYVYSHHFNFEQSAAGQGIAGWAVPQAAGTKNLRRAKMTTASNSDFDEIAVLVGDFPTVDDSRAQKTLKQIKNIRPESLANFTGNGASEDSPLSGDRLRSSTNAYFGGAGDGSSVSDFAMRRNNGTDGSGGTALKASFLLPNPMLPDEYFAAQNVDHFILGLNKRIKYSLLKNDGLYSVKVASFFGKTTFDMDEMKQTQTKQSWLKRNRQGVTQSDLVDAAKKAHVLTDYLRKKGIEAYEFHDRHESYVCVGSYDWAVGENGQGNPEIAKTIMKFKGRMANVPGKRGAIETFTLSPKLVKAGISCDAQPLPVVVPRAPEKTASRLFGRFK